MMKEMFTYRDGFTLSEQFITILMTVISMVCTIPALITILKLRGEEKRNRLEHLLSKAVSRTRLMGSFLAISIVVGFVSLLLAAAGLWSAGAAVMENPVSLASVLKSAMVYLPAMGVMIGAAMLMIGFFPRATGFTWLYMGYSFFAVYLGRLLQLPEWMVKLSPFGNIPKLPIEEINFAQIFVLVLIAAGLMAAGFIGYSRRDMQG